MILLRTGFVRRSIPAACLGVVLLAASGCGPQGPKLAPVRGTVTWKGNPVPYGTVMFQPENGPAATGEIKNGAYVLLTDRRKGAVVGRHRVTVISLADQSNRLPEERAPLPPPLVPLEYSFPDRSGLTAEVQDKENVIDFPLK
jgi:hypothetical protein